MIRSATFGAALAALFLLPMLAATAYAQQPLHPFPPAVAATDIMLTKMLADRPLSTQEKRLLTDMDRASFLHDPDSMRRIVARQNKTIQQVRSFDPVHRADWRKQSLTRLYFAPDATSGGDVEKLYAAICTRQNPIIEADPASKTIICQRDIDAWQAMSKVLSAQSGVAGESVRDMIATARSPDFSWMPRITAAHMERDWICYQLCWPHKPAADREKARVMVADGIRRRWDRVQGTVKGPAGSCTADWALLVADRAYSDYPAALDPHFAAQAGKTKRGGMVGEMSSRQSAINGATQNPGLSRSPNPVGPVWDPGMPRIP